MDFKEPTEQEPFILGKFKIYPTYLTINDEKLEYEKICGIKLHTEINTYNGFTTKKEAYFDIAFTNTETLDIMDKERFIIRGEADYSFNPFKDRFSIAIYAHNLIAKYTFINRLKIAIYQVQKYGYYKHEQLTYFLGYSLSELCKIHNNGDVELPKTDKKLNIIEAGKNDLLGSGTSNRSMKSSQSSSNELVILERKATLGLSLLGFSLVPHTIIDHSFNSDIFLEFVERLLKFGRITY